MPASRVVGVDGTADGWLAADVSPDGKIAFRWSARLDALVAALPQASVIAVDIPIGLPAEGYRRADQEARAWLGSRRGTVFLVPPEPILRLDDYGAARRLWNERSWKGASRQAFALRGKIFEAAEVATADDRIYEVHPEVSFQLMNGRPLRGGKHSWDGLVERLRLLEIHGLTVPAIEIGAAAAGPDDVVDAVAAAWSARRVAAGEARSFPAQREDGEPAIWG